MRRLTHLAAVCLSTLCLAPAHAASLPASVCGLLQTGAVESIIGARIASAKDMKGMLSLSCTFTTVAGKYGPGFVMVELYTMAVPKGEVKRLLMRKGEDDVYVELPGTGDYAIMNQETDEMAVYVADRVYKIITRGMPCKGNPHGSQEEREACDQARLAALPQLGKLLTNK